MSQGLPIAIIGYVMVFIVLALLWAVLASMKYFFIKTPKQEQPAAKPADPAPVPKPAAPKEDDSALVAVLTAAVAASLNTSTYKLRIKSYRQIDTKNPAWARAGRNETIANRY